MSENNLTLSEVEAVLANQGCVFSYNHGFAPGTTLPVRLALKQIDDRARASFFYYGKDDEKVSEHFLETASTMLKIDRMVLGLA